MLLLIRNRTNFKPDPSTMSAFSDFRGGSDTDPPAAVTTSAALDHDESDVVVSDKSVLNPSVSLRINGGPDNSKPFLSPRLT
jgi:hypothetical protein